MFELPQFSNIVNKLFLSFYNQKVHIYEKLYGFSIEVQVQILYVFLNIIKAKLNQTVGGQSTGQFLICNECLGQAASSPTPELELWTKRRRLCPQQI